MPKDPDAVDLNKLVEMDLSSTDFMIPLLDVVARHSWWVPRKVYESVQVVYPRTRRKSGREERRAVDVSGNKLWFNEPAIRAFWRACDKRPEEMKNYYICHIYENSVHDPDHFTNLASLTAFPQCLQSLTEWHPVSSVLKYHASEVYGYNGPVTIVPPPPAYYQSEWNHQSELPPEKLIKVVSYLQAQKRNNPQYSGTRKTTGTREAFENGSC